MRGLGLVAVAWAACCCRSRACADKGEVKAGRRDVLLVDGDASSKRCCKESCSGWFAGYKPFPEEFCERRDLRPREDGSYPRLGASRSSGGLPCPRGSALTHRGACVCAPGFRGELQLQESRSAAVWDGACAPVTLPFATLAPVDLRRPELGYGVVCKPSFRGYMAPDMPGPVTWDPVAQEWRGRCGPVGCPARAVFAPDAEHDGAGARCACAQGHAEGSGSPLRQPEPSADFAGRCHADTEAFVILAAYTGTGWTQFPASALLICHAGAFDEAEYEWLRTQPPDTLLPEVPSLQSRGPGFFAWRESEASCTSVKFTGDTVMHDAAGRGIHGGMVKLSGASGASHGAQKWYIDGTLPQPEMYLKGHLDLHQPAASSTTLPELLQKRMRAVASCKPGGVSFRADEFVAHTTNGNFFAAVALKCVFGLSDELPHVGGAGASLRRLTASMGTQMYLPDADCRCQSEAPFWRGKRLGPASFGAFVSQALLGDASLLDRGTANQSAAVQDSSASLADLGAPSLADFGTPAAGRLAVEIESEAVLRRTARVFDLVRRAGDS